MHTSSGVPPNHGLFISHVWPAINAPTSHNADGAVGLALLNTQLLLSSPRCASLELIAFRTPRLAARRWEPPTSSAAAGAPASGAACPASDLYAGGCLWVGVVGASTVALDYTDANAVRGSILLWDAGAARNRTFRVSVWVAHWRGAHAA